MIARTPAAPTLITPGVLRFIALAAAIAFAALPALAVERPRLRADVTVTSD